MRRLLCPNAPTLHSEQCVLDVFLDAFIIFLFSPCLLDFSRDGRLRGRGHRLDWVVPHDPGLHPAQLPTRPRPLWAQRGLDSVQPSQLCGRRTGVGLCDYRGHDRYVLLFSCLRTWWLIVPLFVVRRITDSYPLAVLEGVWGIVGFVGLVRIGLSRRKGRTQQEDGA